MHQEKTLGTEEFEVVLNGIGFKARQYLGIGTLNVHTGRGEVKANSGDFVISGKHESFVVSQTLFEELARANDPKIIPLADFLEQKVFNSKSGPDKFQPDFPPSPPSFVSPPPPKIEEKPELPERKPEELPSREDEKGKEK